MPWATMTAGAAVNSWWGPRALFISTALQRRSVVDTAVLKVLSNILLDIDSGNLSTLVSLDLSAAFKTVDHEILLR